MLKNNIKINTHFKNIKENVLTDPSVRNHLIWYAGIIFLYTCFHVYLGIRGWQAFGSFLNKPFYILSLAGLGLLFPASLVSLDQGRENRIIPKIIAYTGFYWAAFFLYMILSLLGIDFFRLLNNLSRQRLERLLPAGFPANLPAAGISLILFITILLTIGTFLARHPRVRVYPIKVDKPFPMNRPLRVAVVSDIHFGSLVSTADLSVLRRQVNLLQPDLILLAGDIIDNSLSLIRKTDFVHQLSGLESRYGVFAVLGNHEYANADPDEVIEYFREADIQVLKDTTILIDHAFYLAGRNEKRSEWSGLLGQKTPEQLLENIDRQLPVLLMQHQPNDLPALDAVGIDVAVAGHTHRGQMFPLNLLSHRHFDQSFGYRQMNHLQNIISAGYGTWGPPIRLGSRSEIVLLEIDCNK